MNEETTRQAIARLVARGETEPPRDRRLLVVTMTGFRRPEYQRKVLAALSRCEGVENWVLMPQVDPARRKDRREGVREVFAEFDACEQRPIFNRDRLGLNRNTQAVLVRAMKLRPDVLVHLEDDTVPSPDALTYFDWAVDQLKGLPERVVLASGYHKLDPGSGAIHYRTADRPIWSPWGWAVCRRRLIWILKEWCTKNPKCFTCRIKETFKSTRYELYPLLSRIQNIGYDLGENNRSPEWYRKNHRCDRVAGDDLPPGDFTLPPALARRQHAG